MPWGVITLACSLYFFTIYLYLFGCAGSQLWQVGSSSQTRDQTQAPCIGSSKPWPLGLQEVLGLLTLKMRKLVPGEGEDFAKIPQLGWSRA